MGSSRCPKTRASGGRISLIQTTRECVAKTLYEYSAKTAENSVIPHFTFTSKSPRESRRKPPGDSSVGSARCREPCEFRKRRTRIGSQPRLIPPGDNARCRAWGWALTCCPIPSHCHKTCGRLRTVLISTTTCAQRRPRRVAKNLPIPANTMINRPLAIPSGSESVQTLAVMALLILTTLLHASDAPCRPRRMCATLEFSGLAIK